MRKIFMIAFVMIVLTGFTFCCTGAENTKSSFSKYSGTIGGWMTPSVNPGKLGNASEIVGNHTHRLK